MPRWERTRSQRQKHHRDSLAEAKAPPSAVSENIFTDLSDWIGEDDDLQAHLESFKKMVFTMLNGKKKSVEVGKDDDDDEAVTEAKKAGGGKAELKKLDKLIKDFKDLEDFFGPGSNSEMLNKLQTARADLASKIGKKTESANIRATLQALKEAMAGGKIQPIPALGAPAKKKAKGGWKCQECGKKMSLKTAQKMECPKCGGSDIDLDND